MDFILTRNLSPQNTAWLKKTLRQDGIESEFTSVSDIKLGLILWLSDNSSGSVRFVLDEIIGENGRGISAAGYGGVQPSGVRLHKQDFTAKAGITEIGLQLEAILKDSPGSFIDIHISGENADTIVSETIVSLIAGTIEQHRMHYRMILSVSNRSEAAAHIMHTYLKYITEGTISLYVAHEDKNSLTEQTTFIMPHENAVIISEILYSRAPPAALFVMERSYVYALRERFDKTLVYAQPVFTPLREVSSRRVQSMYLEDYEKSGLLSIIRDGITSLYMSPESFDLLLRKQGYAGDAFRWRSSSFKSLQTAIDGSLRNGMEIREIISMEWFMRLYGDGEFLLPGEALFDVGLVTVDKESLVSMLEGYFHFIQMYPNLHVRFYENLDPMLWDIEWQLKDNSHVIIKRKNDELQPLLYSQQPVFVYAIEQYYEGLWREILMRGRERYSPQPLFVLENAIGLLKAKIKNGE